MIADDVRELLYRYLCEYCKDSVISMHANYIFWLDHARTVRMCMKTAFTCSLKALIASYFVSCIFIIKPDIHQPQASICLIS